MQVNEEKQELVEEESSSSSSCSSSEEAVAVLAKVESREQVEDDHGDDEGYHTPTSPRSRIPAATECPPAPKKPTLRQRFKKRKAACFVEIKDVELVFVARRDEGKRSKKARTEVASSE